MTTILNIVLVRIDDRLIHGQVMTAWVKCTQGNKIIIVDDEIAQDPFMQKVLVMLAPPGIKVLAQRIKDAVEELKKDGVPNEKVIILVKNPQTIYSLVEGGVGIKELVVGGMGAKAGRKALFRNIFASPEERDVFRNLAAKGVKAYIRIVPDDKAVEVEKHL